LHGEEKYLRAMSIKHDELLANGQVEAAAALAQATEAARTQVRNKAFDRASILTDPLARLTALVGAHDVGVFDGEHGTNVSTEKDGSFTVRDSKGNVMIDGISADPKSERSIDTIERTLRDPAKVREMEAAARQKKIEQGIAESAPSKMASTDRDKATAEYYRGAKTAMTEAQAEAVRARAQGASSGIQQQKWDAQQAKEFKADIAPVIAFPNVTTQKNEVNLDGDQLVHGLMVAGYSPQFIRDKVYSLRTENPEPEKFSLAARQVIANLRRGPAPPQPQQQPATAARPVAAPPATRPAAQTPTPGLQRGPTASYGEWMKAKSELADVQANASRMTPDSAEAYLASRVPEIEQRIQFNAQYQRY
jgi:hypothetical protein